ncbi:alpha/beta hydrolase fold domain-containing protein [Actinomadura sp. WMMB 499]|nr:alpha/beta hydrolase fold domain-containing protein [Actinomadura sp. WMMB 499]
MPVTDRTPARPLAPHRDGPGERRDAGSAGPPADAASSGCAVVTVDHRRPPELPFPTPLGDCPGAIRRIHRAAALIEENAHEAARYLTPRNTNR